MGYYELDGSYQEDREGICDRFDQDAMAEDCGCINTKNVEGVFLNFIKQGLSEDAESKMKLMGYPVSKMDRDALVGAVYYLMSHVKDIRAALLRTSKELNTLLGSISVSMKNKENQRRKCLDELDIPLGQHKFMGYVVGMWREGGCGYVKFLYKEETVYALPKDWEIQEELAKSLVANIFNTAMGSGLLSKVYIEHTDKGYVVTEA